MKLPFQLPSRLTIAAVLGCVILFPLAIGGAWMAGIANRDKVQAERLAKDLDTQITAPSTGYIARLTACQTSLRGAEASVKRQNQAVDILTREAADATARANAAVSSAQAQARAAERRAQAVLQARPAEGETVCDAAFRLHQEDVQ